MTVKRLLMLLILGTVLLAMPVMTTAQEAAAAAETTAPAEPAGLSTLVFLLGVGAIIVVGGRSLGRDNFKQDNESK
jgi:hypothetical protein